MADLPINRPVCPVKNFHRDRQGSHKINKGKVNYWPNRFEAGAPANHYGEESSASLKTYPEQVGGIKARVKGPKFNEHLSQAQLFYNLLQPHEKMHLQSALSFELDHCDDPVVSLGGKRLFNSDD